MIGYHQFYRLRFFIYFRIFFGLGNFMFSPFQNFVLKLYSIVVAIIITAAGAIFIQYYGTDTFHRVVVLVEYFAYSLISFVAKGEDVRSFFQYLPSLDSFPGANREYRKMMNSVIFVLSFSIAWRITVTVIVLYLYSASLNTLVGMEIFFFIVITVAIDLGRASTFIYFSILYFRLKIFKTMLRSTDFNSTRNISVVYKFIQIYELLADKFRKIQKVLKLQVSIARQIV
ncbi:hypothetical protein B5X24_HaOG200847 [Helicoverpa armigera]|uniref:Uncharacterized protein n=1 Tax=Helicoverpa armigera TaxID=29058 RepID=A0A2W1BIK3_HELAM|nr:hypothetical protein B5X24_HaOG200847 [Helicoverpa armigera]